MNRLNKTSMLFSNTVVSISEGSVFPYYFQIVLFPLYNIQ